MQERKFWKDVKVGDTIYCFNVYNPSDLDYEYVPHKYKVISIEEQYTSITDLHDADIAVLIKYDNDHFPIQLTKHALETDSSYYDTYYDKCLYADVNEFEADRQEYIYDAEADIRSAQSRLDDLKNFSIE